MQYEIFHDSTGWRWRLVEKGGRVLASAPRALDKAQCLTAVRILQMSTDAPLLVRAGGVSLAPETRVGVGRDLELESRSVSRVVD